VQQLPEKKWAEQGAVLLQRCPEQQVKKGLCVKGKVIPGYTRQLFTPFFVLPLFFFVIAFLDWFYQAWFRKTDQEKLQRTYADPSREYFGNNG
jgi:hypothetical protein